MVASSSNNGYSSSSSEEDFRPSTVKARAKENLDASVDNRRVTYDEIKKRRAEDDESENRLRRRVRIDRWIAAAEEKLRSRADGAEREEEEFWDAYEEDIHPDFLNIRDSDSDEESEEDSAEDDDEPDDSDKSDDSDESD
ncbi:glutamic acid-rich protein-like [Papaver somniferum]|uniref:glutamic acid-rich protein-like n=1 Tax=Papaver somniferum TaxID=3469 RepID=UPI000E6F4A03|nr:glutamic acid-rich protein-like [Papaver somniferum]